MPVRASRRIAIALRASLASAAVAVPAAAQHVTVRGLAYDSLAGAPLADAFVAIDGTRSTTSDRRGRFRFDSVAPGVHLLTMQHAALDSVGLTGVASRATVADGREELVIAAPSFATLWHRVCGATPPPADSGLVFGTVAAPTGEPVASATVDLTWMQLAVEHRRDVTQRQWRAQARTGPNGAYGICGAPTDVALQLRATTDSGASGWIDLPPGHPRVQRRDLVVATRRDSTAGARGTIAGVVTDSAGRPFANARVVMDDVPEVRTRDDGRFTLRDVPVGTRQIEVFGIGMSPNAVAVNVAPGDTASITVQMRRVTTLQVVRVTAAPRVRRFVDALEERRRTGLGRFMDSTQVAGHGTLASVFREFPSVQVEGGSRFTLMLPGMMHRCTATLWIDGFTSNSAEDYDQLQMLRPDEIAAVEVYVRNYTLPIRFTTKNTTCGAVVVWTKWMLQ